MLTDSLTRETLTGETATAEHFRERLQTNSLINYINYVSDDMLWESETTGGWANADRMLFSIRGNSYEWNRYYLNGYRMDSRFLSGSMLYVPAMQQTSLQTDAERGVLYLQDHQQRDYFSAEGNIGGLGGISWGTRQLINLFHTSAEERLEKPIEQRNRQLGAGEVALGYGIPYEANGAGASKTLYQHAYANFGTRRIVTFDEGGEAGYYDATYFKVQLAGELPLGRTAAEKGVSMHYVYDMQQRPDLYSELGYNAEEVADYKGYSASVYVKSKPHRLTTGVTYALHDARHQNRNYERNIVDQDGEGFDPWNADGRLHELSWAVNYTYPIDQVEGMRLHLDAYNSLLHFSQADSVWGHNLYVQYARTPREDWYRYDFSGRNFTAGMLENTLALDYDKQVTHWLQLHASAGLVLDGIVLRNRPVVSPSVEAEVSTRFTPTKWFDASIVLGHYRSKATWNQVRLLSEDYQNGQLTGAYAPYAYYGGEYLEVKPLMQLPQYAVLDLPIVFTAAKRHKFSILTTARLYYHNWQIANNSAYGATELVQVENNTQTPFAAAQRPYVLQYQAPVEGAGLFALPLYLSNTLKYTYEGEKVYFSLSWQSYQMSGLTTHGNGAENNSISTLTYSMLHPTLGENLKNPESGVRALGRLDQDKAFICRVQMGANITENWQLMANFHFQDGTPISNYVTKDGLLYQNNTKGINPKDGHFGMRKDAFFNLDIRLAYRGNINMRNQKLEAAGAVPFSVEVLGYNLYDFGTAWYEYSFDQQLEHRRRTLSLCIPRGLTLKVSVGLSKN